MPLISVTRLHLRSWRFFPAFIVYALRSSGQAQRAPGFVAGALGRDRQNGFWTVTVWRDEAAMRDYRNSGVHAKAMPRLLHWCDEASVGHWLDAGGALPDPATAFERMRDTGRVSKVRYPSKAHESGRTVGEGPPWMDRRLAPPGGAPSGV